MPLADALQSLFSLGEIDPRFKGQLSSEQYRLAVDYLKNYHIMPGGGLVRRSGTVFVDEARTQSGECRIIPFVISEDDAYLIETEPGGSWAAYKNYAKVADIALGFSGVLNHDYQHIQIGNTKFFSSNGWPLTLTRNSDSSWTPLTLRVNSAGPTVIRMKGPFNDPNTLDDGSLSNITLTPNNVNATSFTASAAFFDDAWTGNRLFRVVDSAGNYAIYMIATYTSTTQVGVTQIDGGALADTTARSVWELGLLYWDIGGTLPWGGFKTLAYYQDRLVLSGFDIAPQKVAISAPGNFYDFQVINSSGGATGSMVIDIGDQRANKINYVQATERGILTGTLGGEWIIKSPTEDAALAPDSIEAVPVSSCGSAPDKGVLPVEDVYLQQTRGRRSIKKVKIGSRYDVIRTDDLSEPFNHLLTRQIGEMALQVDPATRLWFTKLRDNPIATSSYDDAYSTEIICGLYNKESNNSPAFVAPCRIVLGGTSNASGDPPEILSVAVIPSQDGTRDEVYLLTNRYIGGSNIRVIEYFAPDFETDTDHEDYVGLDCAVVGSYAEHVASISKANPAVVTVSEAATGFTNGQTVYFTDLSGMTNLNDNAFTVANVSGQTFELVGVDSTAFDDFEFSHAARVRLRYSTLTQLDLAGEELSTIIDGTNSTDITLNGSGVGSLPSAGQRVQMGYAFDSKVRLLPPNMGSARGTALGKTQRVHRVSAILYRCASNIKIGRERYNQVESRTYNLIDSATLSNVENVSGGEALFSGVASAQVEADYTLAQKLVIEQTTPGPAMILAINQHLSTQDR